MCPLRVVVSWVANLSAKVRLRITHRRRRLIISLRIFGGVERDEELIALSPLLRYLCGRSSTRAPLDFISRPSISGDPIVQQTVC